VAKFQLSLAGFDLTIQCVSVLISLPRKRPMAKQKQFIFWPLHWICLVVVVGFFLVILVVARKQVVSRRVTIVADSNGILRLHGISLANTNVRDAIFKTMGVLEG
jgi:hypothetical protein